VAERRRAAPAVAAGVVLLAVTGCTGSDAGADATSTPPPPTGRAEQSAIALENAYERTIRAVLPSVVEIRTPEGLGSGVVWDDAGHVVTNAHVVGDAQQFRVYVSGQAEPVPAELVGSYGPEDLAVLRMTGDVEARPATFAEDGQVQVGDIVLAMGNPLGLSSTVTNGIVSAVGRTVTEPGQDGAQGATIPNVIQTSASINPGNSGGALVDLDGHVVGIPTLGASGPSGAAAPGIGFAVPAETVRRIVPQLVESGRVTDSGRAALGVTVTTVTDGAGEAAGAGIVEATDGGAAAQAGLEPGDVVVAVAGTPTPDPRSLARVLAEQDVGAVVPVQVVRGGERRQVDVTLGALP
jgi:putative serine protease PepD